MSPQLKEFLIRNTHHIEKEEFDKLICPEVMEKGWLDELLNFLYKCGGSVSTEVVTQQLINFYIKDASDLTANQKEDLETKTRYLMNKHQIELIKTISTEKP